MRARFMISMCVLLCLAAVASVSGRPQADPLTGTWAGDWGPNERDRNQVTVELKLDGSAVTGVVRTADRTEATLGGKSTFDRATGVLRMETSVQGRRGGTVNYVIEGKLANNVITGSWNHDAVKGDFKITKK